MKPKLTLDRWYLDGVTLGLLSAPERGLALFTLELPWLDNERSISCIPEGEYEAIYRQSPKNGEVFELLNVPDRTYIQFHKGNFNYQTEGCILVGKNIGFYNEGTIPDVGRSGDAMEQLLDNYADTGFYLEIL